MRDLAREAAAEAAVGTLVRLISLRYGMGLADGGVHPDMLDRLARFILTPEAERPVPWLLPWIKTLTGESLLAASAAGAVAVLIEWDDSAGQGRGGIVAVPVE